MFGLRPFEMFIMFALRLCSGTGTQRIANPLERERFYRSGTGTQRIANPLERERFYPVLEPFEGSYLNCFIVCLLSWEGYSGKGPF